MPLQYFVINWEQSLQYLHLNKLLLVFRRELLRVCAETILIKNRHGEEFKESRGNSAWIEDTAANIVNNVWETAFQNKDLLGCLDVGFGWFGEELNDLHLKDCFY